MDNIVTQNTGEDSVKRLKIIILAFAISFSLFFTKVLSSQGSLLTTYLVAGIYALVAVVGMLWAFNFQVKLKSFVYILQGGLFVFSEVLFVLLFFFKQFDRIYEGILLIVLLVFIWLVTYTCFLMVNVFNVALVKNLPLIQVAQTASYILTLLMMYFFTFALLASEFPIYVIFPLMFLIYLFLLYVQFSELGMESTVIWRRVVMIALINLFVILPFLFVDSSHEIISIVPMVGGFVGGGLLNLSNQKNIKWQVFGYNFLLVMTILIVLYLSFSF